MFIIIKNDKNYISVVLFYLKKYNTIDSICLKREEGYKCIHKKGKIKY